MNLTGAYQIVPSCHLILSSSFLFFSLLFGPKSFPLYILNLLFYFVCPLTFLKCLFFFFSLYMLKLLFFVPLHSYISVLRLSLYYKTSHFVFLYFKTFFFVALYFKTLFCPITFLNFSTIFFFIL
jgi:hypothetical protein